MNIETEYMLSLTSIVIDLWPSQCSLTSLRFKSTALLTYLHRSDDDCWEKGQQLLSGIHRWESKPDPFNSLSATRFQAIVQRFWQPHSTTHMVQPIRELDLNAPTLLLLSRDVISVQKVRKQVKGPDFPYAQKLDLGCCIVYLKKAHRPLTVNAFYTNTAENGHPTIFKPCPNLYLAKEK